MRKSRSWPGKNRKGGLRFLQWVAVGGMSSKKPEREPTNPDTFAALGGRTSAGKRGISQGLQENANSKSLPDTHGWKRKMDLYLALGPLPNTPPHPRKPKKTPPKTQTKNQNPQNKKHPQGQPFCQ